MGEKNTSSEQPRKDHFSRLMFGSGQRRTRNQQIAAENTDKSEGTLDYFEIARQVDSILGQIDELKPLVKEMSSPIIKYLKGSK